MMSQSRLTTMLIFLFAFNVFAFSSDSLKSKFDYQGNGMQIISILIDDANFFEEWQKPEMPQIRPVDTFELGAKVYPIIIFSTSNVDENGYPDLTYNITIKKPDGSEYGKYTDLMVWKDKSAPQMHLLKQPIAIMLESTDPLGIYEIDITVFDNVKKNKVEIPLSFKVVQNDVMSSEELSYQLHNFYKDKNYTLIPGLIKAIDRSTILENENAQPSIIGFFTSVFSEIPFENTDNMLNSNSLETSFDFFSYCHELSITKDTVLNWSGHDASINDLLWGAYFASGDDRIIERLISEMQYCEERDSIYLYLAGASAKWSLCSNSRQHPSIKKKIEEYSQDCTGILKNHLDGVMNSEPSELREEMVKNLQTMQNQ